MLVSENGYFSAPLLEIFISASLFLDIFIHIREYTSKFPDKFISLFDIFTRDIFAHFHFIGQLKPHCCYYHTRLSSRDSILHWLYILRHFIIVRGIFLSAFMPGLSTPLRLLSPTTAHTVTFWKYLFLAFSSAFILYSSSTSGTTLVSGREFPRHNLLGIYIFTYFHIII